MTKDFLSVILITAILITLLIVAIKHLIATLIKPMKNIIKSVLNQVEDFWLDLNNSSPREPSNLSMAGDFHDYEDNEENNPEEDDEEPNESYQLKIIGLLPPIFEIDFSILPLQPNYPWEKDLAYSLIHFSQQEFERVKSSYENQISISKLLPLLPKRWRQFSLRKLQELCYKINRNQPKAITGHRSKTANKEQIIRQIKQVYAL